MVYWRTVILKNKIYKMSANTDEKNVSAKTHTKIRLKMAARVFFQPTDLTNTG